MESNNNTFYLQAAGIIDRKESEMLIEAGFNMLGFPLRLEYHKEDISEAEAKEIIKSLPNEVTGVLITYLNKADEIASFCDYLGAAAVQIHGDISLYEIEKLRIAAPHLFLIKSLVVGLYSLETLKETAAIYADFTDAFITDTYDAVTGAKGATGKRHDLSISREITEISKIPVILAGGLNAANVYDSLIYCKAAGADVHTGIEESSGRKCRAKAMQFVANALNAKEMYL